MHTQTSNKPQRDENKAVNYLFTMTACGLCSERFTEPQINLRFGSPILKPYVNVTELGNSEKHERVAKENRKMQISRVQFNLHEVTQKNASYKSEVEL